MFLAEWQLHH